MGKQSRGHLDVRLFGHLEVALDGERFKLATPRKSLQVLAYLLLHRGAAVSREYLAYLLYPDDEEGAARAKLRATLSELPKILPPPANRYVTIEGDTVAWNPAADLWIDVDDFESASSDRARLGDAIKLYRGDLLPEIYDEWLDVIRERYRNVYLRCLTDRIASARRDADLPLAIETARSVLAIDPWREDVVRRLIAMRYESGDRAGALSEYGLFAKRLRAEMGTEPMAETAAVAERISRGERPNEAEAEGDRPAFATETAVLPFVGRRDEMERLLETWSRAARGRGACVFVGGEPGIGKSRLVMEFARSVEDRGGRVLVGTTSSPEAVPYECIVDALRSALPLLASLKPTVALASVAALLPELHARLPLPDVARLGGDGERIRLFDSLFRSIADLARPRPLLMILEDLQWAQAGSLELLQFLLRRITGAPVMIVVTYRDEETARLGALHRLRREVRGGGGASNLWLSRLSASEVEELRGRLLGVAERSAQRLLDASQGNPLFISQLLADAGEGERAALPGSLEDVFVRRIERLSESARTAAEIAACVGDRFSRDAVREVSAWDERELNEAFDELLDRRIIREAGGRGFFEYAFAHQLMHETVARAVPAKHAGVRRRRVARVFERLYPERFSELSPLIAGHYEAGGDIANAARCYLEAIRRSTAIGALVEARALCTCALALATDPQARAQLLLESVVIESRSGNLTSRDAVIAELERAAESLGDPAVHRSALLHRIDYAVAAGNNAILERAVGALRDSITTDDPQSQAMLHLEEARLASALARLDEAYDAAQSALACSRACGDDAGMARAFSAMAQVAAHRGPLDDAAALFDEAAQAAARAENPALQLLAISSGWTVAYQRRDIRHCRELGESALDLAVKLGDRPSEAHAHSRLGTAFAYEGSSFAEARRQFAEAAKIYAETGNPAGSGGQFMNRAVLEMRAGFAERALTATLQAIELFDRASDVRGRIGALSNLAYVYAFIGQADEARRCGLEALELARQHGFNMLEASTLENLASAEGAGGEYARAIEYAQASLEQRSRSKSQVWWGKTLADVALWQAALGNLSAARAAVERLLSNEDAIARGDWPEFCYWAAAQIFHRDGRTAEANRALERARHLMLQAANKLEPEDRESYMAISFHVELRRAAENGVWPI